MEKKRPKSSPPWGTTTKLVVALTAVAIIAALLVHFQYLIPPLLMAFILTYLLHPIASLLNKSTPLSWRASVTVIFLLMVILLISLLTIGGLGLVQQIQSVITLLQNSLTGLPDFVNRISGQVYHIGPFAIDFRHLDLQTFSQQLLSIIQPLLGQTGNLVGTLASGAIQTFGWFAFIMLVSYFALAESGGLHGGILRVEIPHYADDMRRINLELGRIWNAFLRGQIIIFVMTFVVYTLLLSVLGVRYAIGLALLAGFAKFLPYIGPAITWIIMGLVTFFQVYKPFGLSPLAYTGLVILLALVIDQIFDSIVAPRIMAHALKVHPAAVLIAAIIAANLLGLLGVIIAAPILATLKLLGQYTLRKMLEVDPFPEEEQPPAQPSTSLLRQLRNWWESRRRTNR
jgi:predicted PurR-regulated permease PerM